MIKGGKINVLFFNAFCSIINQIDITIDFDHFYCEFIFDLKT